MNKNILIALVLVFTLVGFVGVAQAKDGSDDNKSYSSSNQGTKSDDSSEDSDDSNSGLEIEANIFTNETVIKVEINDNKSIFSTQAKTRAEIATEILAKYPSLTIAQIETALKIETEDRSSRPNDIALDKSEGDDGDDNDEKNKMGEEHRSAVADVVLKLKEVADKDKKIGEEVKKVAEEQNESAKKATEAIKEIEKRSGWKVFFVGTDYKNLGGLRSEMVTTENNIDRLTKALEKATDPAVKAQLDLEIKALQAEKLKVDTFIDDNEGKFSLFGWLVKLFN